MNRAYISIKHVFDSQCREMVMPSGLKLTVWAFLCSGNDLPKQLRAEAYDENGQPREINEVVFLGLDTNPSFSEDVFAFRPPPGYAVSDSRQQPPQMLVPAQEFPADGGETISQALAEPAFVGVPPADKKSRWEMSELLMATSRPAEVTESQPALRTVSQP
jgi:hypothetical protein